MMTAISTTSLSKVYFETNRGKKVSGAYKKTAVDHIAVSIDKAELVAIMGKSGSGKSTLLRLMGGIDKPSSGAVMINGVDISKYDNRELSKLRREQIGFIFQDFCLIDTLTVLENIMLPLLLNKTAPETAKKKAVQRAAFLGIEDILGRSPLEISGGEKQRVAICRAVVGNPSILLADEPTGNLDTENTKTVIETMRTVNQTYGNTVVTVTHDPYIASHCDRVLYMQDGKIKHDIRKDSGQAEGAFMNQLIRELYSI